MGRLPVASLIAFVFIAWPIVGNYAGAGKAWTSTLVLTGTLIAGLALSLASGGLSGGFPPASAISLLFLAALANGWAVYAYAGETAKPNAASFIVLTTVMMTVLAPLFSWALLREVPSLNQWIGFALAGGAIYFLSGK